MKAELLPKLHTLTISSLAFSVMLACFLAGAQCLPPPSGIVGWWPGDGNTTDIIGGNNGTLMNGAGYAPGEVGSAFQVDSTNNYIQISDSATLKPAKVSVEAWVKFDSYNASGGDDSDIVNKRNGRDASYKLSLSVQGFKFRISTDGSVTYAFGQASYLMSILTNQFYHLVGTYDQNVVRIYVNGVAGFSQNWNGQIAYNNSPVCIGGTNQFGNISKSVEAVDEVAIYNRVLSASEVAALYAAGIAGKCKTLPYITIPPQGQTGYWGQSANFSVTATTNYPPLSYQWLSNGVVVLDATNQTLLLTNLQSSFAAGYSVVVSNPNGSVTSAPPANLTINAADTSISLYPGVLIKGVVGYTYGVQSSTNLADPNSWMGLTNLTLSTSNLVWYDSLPSSLSKKFYRVLQGPIPIP